MNYTRVSTIVDKEWAEVFRNRMVIFTISLLPVVFTVLPLVMVWMISHTASGGMSSTNTEIPPAFMHNSCQNIGVLECMQIYLINEFLLMFLMMPLIIPVAIAAYSIVGEKTTRSLEPLLATPITTAELLTGKALASALPAILITWICFGVFLLLLPLVGATQALMAYILGPVWIVAILVIGPLMALASVNLAVIISSRVNDPRVAEQMAAVLIVPILGALFGQLAGVIILDLKLMFMTILGFIILDIGLIYTGARLFRRETILTQWK
jgi:ABC-2 type transport system permease protein